MAKNKIAIAVCVGVAILGCLVAWWIHAPRVIPTIEARQTNILLAQPIDTMDSVAARVEEKAKQTEREVVLVRETVRAKVAVLPDDDVCKLLNHELSRFRGMDSGASRLRD